MSELEDRVRALEAAHRLAASSKRREERMAVARERELDMVRLRSGGPVGEGLPAGAFEAIPDLGAPLLARLRDTTGFDDAQSSEVWSANMLDDPTFESILRNGNVTLTTGWSRVGAKWEARKVVVSGDSPTVIVRKTFRRKVMAGQIYRSDILVFDTSWSDGETGQVHVELRPTRHAPASPHIDWPWVVPAARVYVDNAVHAFTNLVDDEANVRMLVKDKEGTLLDTGEDIDLDPLSSDRQEGRAWVGTEDVSNGAWFWLQIDLHKSTASGAGGVAVGVGEPQINYTYQEAPMPYEPLLGASDLDGSEKAPTDGGWLVDDFDRDQPTPTITAGSAWPGFPVRYQADVGIAYDGETEIPFSLIQEINAVLGGEVASFIGDPPAAMAFNHPNNDCGGFAFKIAGWHEKVTYYAITVPEVPGDVAGATIQLNYAFTFGTGTVAAERGFRVTVQSVEPTTVRGGTGIGYIPGDGSTATIFIPSHLIPDEGQTMWIGVEPQWRADLDGAVCSFNWPYNTNAGDSGWAFVEWGGGTFATWQTWTSPSFDMGTILEGGPNGTGSWWVGLNRYVDLGSFGTPLFGITGGCYFVAGTTNVGKGFAVRGPREDEAEPEGPWSGGLGVHEFDFQVDEEGMVGEPGQRELMIRIVAESRVVIARVHLGDPVYAPGVSVTAPFVTVYAAEAIAADTAYTLRIDTRSGFEARVSVFAAGTGPPPFPDVIGPMFETEETGDRVEIWGYVGNGSGEALQTLRVCEWRFGDAVGSGGEVRGELLGFGDGMRTIWQTAAPFRAGSSTLLADGHHQQAILSDPETGLLGPGWAYSEGVEVRADYVRL